MRVGLVFGGRSVEHLVSLRSAKTVREALLQAGHDVIPLGIDTDGRWHNATASQAVLEGSFFPSLESSPLSSLEWLRSGAPEVIFPIAHGTFGEDGCLQGLCEMVDLPYVGCSVAASAVAMDKRLSKQLFAAHGLAVVPFVAVGSHPFASHGMELPALQAFMAQQPLPLFVKPSVGGSSVGCRKARSVAELRDAIAFALRFDGTAIVERAVSAREVEVAVLGDDDALRASELGEIVPGNDFYDYEDKYLNDNAKLLAPAPVSPALKQQLQQAAMLAMTAIGGAGMARVDFFVEADGSFTLNEVNTVPGFTSVSMYPRLWGLSGIPVDRLVDELVQIAVRRQRRQRKTHAALRAFVASITG
jgi:D-alanine-D-alanine ligase